jgi:high-affinity iron transporter
MLASFIITLREGLEAGLIISILLAYLNKTGRPRLKRQVYLGVALALVASLLVAWAFGEAYRKIGESFEGVAALVAAGLLTYMIFWMAEQGRHMKNKLESRAAAVLSGSYGMAMGGLAFISVFREGTETVLFLGGLAAGGTHQVLYGTAPGLIAVLVLSFVLFRTSYRLNIGQFFRYSGYLLLFFAAGMVATGTLALQSAGWLPSTIVAWNTEGLLSQHTLIGNLLNALFGYTSQPSVLQVIFYAAYLALVFYMSLPAFKNAARRHDLPPNPHASYAEDDPFAPLNGAGYSSRLYRLLRHPLLPRVTQVVMSLLFVFLIVAAIAPLNIGPFNNQGPLHWGPFQSAENQNNLFNFIIWVIWLPLVSLTAVFLSRFWCGNLCPLRLAANVSRNLADRLIGKPRRTSPYMRIGWILPLNFILITLIVKVPNLQPYARRSAYLFIGIFAVAVLVSFFFRRGTWCRYVCPIGGWLARIARMGVIAVRARRDICAQCHDKTCLHGTGVAGRCPAFLNPTAIESNRYCLECWECVKNCPEDKASLRLGLRFPGSELQKPYAPEPGEALFIAGLMGMYVAAARQGAILPHYNFVLVLVGLTLAGMVGYLAISALIAWLGNISWKESFNKLGYALLPLELATAIVAFGDDAMGFLGITVPAAAVLLGLGFTGSLVLSASILKNNIPTRRWGLAFSAMAAVLILLLTMWLKWYASGQVIDLT